jgi:hypothetical protein
LTEHQLPVIPRGVVPRTTAPATAATTHDAAVLTDLLAADPVAIASCEHHLRPIERDSSTAVETDLPDKDRGTQQPRKAIGREGVDG